MFFFTRSYAHAYLNNPEKCYVFNKIYALWKN